MKISIQNFNQVLEHYTSSKLFLVTKLKVKDFFYFCLQYSSIITTSIEEFRPTFQAHIFMNFS